MIAELNEIISILDAEIPANPLSPRNLRLRGRLENELAKYFKSLEQAFPYSGIEALYYKHVKESLGSDTGDMLDPILAAFQDTLTQRVSGQLTTIYLSGQAEMVAWGHTKAGIPIAYEGQPVQQAIDWAKTQGAKLVTQMDEETKRRLAKVISDGIKSKRGIPGLQRDIRRIFTDMSKFRSTMIARTETASALSQASLNSMKDMGIEGKEWVTAGNPCEICSGNASDGVIPVNQAFSSGDMAPPAHPNATFEGYPFFPYGSLTQMLTSRYDGPSITIEAEIIKDSAELPSRDTTITSDISNGNILAKHSDSSSDLIIRNRSGAEVAIFPERIQLTIGPNHPVLTRRGFVNAQFLNEGDELIYDSRCKIPASSVKFNLKQVHLIEDVFTALAAIVGYTDIPAPSDYFHGDESFCYGEVDVIRTNGDLLPIWDIGGIEHISECNLTGAYTDSIHVASCSSCQLLFDRVFTPTASGLHGGSQCQPICRGFTRPPFLQSYRIISSYNTSFTGRAYDASTSTTLYNIGGIVVKNCECALAPAILRR